MKMTKRTTAATLTIMKLKMKTKKAMTTARMRKTKTMDRDYYPAPYDMVQV